MEHLDKEIYGFGDCSTYIYPTKVLRYWRMNYFIFLSLYSQALSASVFAVCLDYVPNNLQSVILKYWLKILL